MATPPTTEELLQKELTRVADIVRRERHRRHWSQSHLADLAGVALPSIGRIESGRTTRIDVLLPVLAALGLSLQLTTATHDHVYQQVCRLCGEVA